MKNGAALNYNKNDESWPDVTSAAERAGKKLCETKKRDKLKKMLSFLDILLFGRSFCKSDRKKGKRHKFLLTKAYTEDTFKRELFLMLPKSVNYIKKRFVGLVKRFFSYKQNKSVDKSFQIGRDLTASAFESFQGLAKHVKEQCSTPKL